MPTYTEWKCKERMKYGHKGATVKRVQQNLHNHNFKPGDIDGKFGQGTESAVRLCQEFFAYNIDGVIGPKTAGLLQGGMGFDWKGCKPV